MNIKLYLMAEGTPLLEKVYKGVFESIFGKYVWSPYLMIIIPVLIGIVCSDCHKEMVKND